MAKYNLLDENGRRKTTYYNVDEVVAEHTLVQLTDNDGELTAIIHLGPGERLERTDV